MKHNKKFQQINVKFIQVDVPLSIMENVLTEKVIKDQYIVFDSGDKLNPKLKCPKDLNKIWLFLDRHLKEKFGKFAELPDFPSIELNMIEYENNKSKNNIQ